MDFAWQPFVKTENFQRSARLHRLGIGDESPTVSFSQSCRCSSSFFHSSGNNKATNLSSTVGVWCTKTDEHLWPAEPRVCQHFWSRPWCGCKVPGLVELPLWRVGLLLWSGNGIPELRVSGHCDGMIHYPINGGKSTHRFGTQNHQLAGFEDIKNKPMTKAPWPGALYMVGLNLMQWSFCTSAKYARAERVCDYRDDVAPRWKLVQERLEHIKPAFEMGTLQNPCPVMVSYHPFNAECKPFKAQQASNLERLGAIVRKWNGKLQYQSGRAWPALVCCRRVGNFFQTLPDFEPTSEVNSLSNESWETICQDWFVYGHYNGLVSSHGKTPNRFEEDGERRRRRGVYKRKSELSIEPWLSFESGYKVSENLNRPTKTCSLAPWKLEQTTKEFEIPLPNLWGPVAQGFVRRDGWKWPTSWPSTLTFLSPQTNCTTTDLEVAVAFLPRQMPHKNGW